MAVDKLVDSTALDTSLTAIADAIRAKTGGSSQLVFPMQFVSEIGNIPSGGGGALYPLVNGSHTFSNGVTVTVSNGSHVDLVIPSGVTSNGFVNVSDINENSSDYTSLSNIQNKPSKFSVFDGELAVYSLEVSSVPSSFSSNVYGTGTSNLNMAIPGITKTKTYFSYRVFSTASVGCLFFATSSPGTYALDVSFYVNNTQYI